MKKLFIISILIIGTTFQNYSQQVNGEILSDSNNVTIVKLWGTSYERGFAYGYLLADKITELLEGFTIPYWGDDWPLVKEMIAEGVSIQIDSIYWHEVQAMIDGTTAAGYNTSGFTVIDGMAAQVWFDIADWQFSKGKDGLHCSTLMSWGDATIGTDLEGSSVISRHLDWPPIPIVNDKSVIVIHIPSEEDLQPWLLIGYAGDMAPYSGINSSGLSMFTTVLADQSWSYNTQAGYEPLKFTFRKALESADYNQDGVNNMLDIRDAISSNSLGYPWAWNFATLAPSTAVVDSMIAFIAEVAPEAPYITFRDNSYDDLIPGDNLFAANSQIKRNNYNHYCWRYNAIVNHIGDGTGIGSQENWDLMKNYANLGNNSQQFMQYIPEWNQLKLSVYQNGQGAYLHDPISYDLNEFFQLDIPGADFTANLTTIAEGDTVIFTDMTTNNPTSWYWEFEGGTPEFSLEQDPAILYNTPGDFDVILIVNNAYGSDTLLKADYIHVTALSPSCLPEGIIFTSQWEIDQFQTNYPGCIEIEGDVEIFGYNIFNLAGLDCLTDIGGDLYFNTIGSLAALSGLNDIISIGSSLKFFDCDVLTSLTDLESLNFIGGDIMIEQTEVLEDLSGLNNIDTINGNFFIDSNNGLINLDGLESFKHISGDYIITNNPLLIDISGLHNLTTIQEDFYIKNSPLTSLYGLNNLTNIGNKLYLEYLNLVDLEGLNNLTSIGDNFKIENISLLSLSGINNLESIGGTFRIWGSDIHNFVGINNLTSILGDFHIVVNGALTSLYGIENLSFIGGNLEIWNNDTLISIDALNGINSIDANLYIFSNENLPNLTGLNNVNSIGGDLHIYENYSLENLSGLNNLETIGGNLELMFNDSLSNLTGLESLTTVMGSLNLDSNPNLLSMAGLNNLSLIGGNLTIQLNEVLTSLSGLNNVEASSLNDLYIGTNSSLSECDIASICDYLLAPNGIVYIDNNAPGCNSPEEVLDSCIITTVEEIVLDGLFSISPNPCSDIVSLEFTITGIGIVNLNLYEISGVRVEQLVNEQKMPGTYLMEFDLKDLEPGVYICILKTSRGVQIKKIIKL